MILLVLFYVFVAFTGIQIIYYLTFSSILFKKKKQIKNYLEHPISVIIFAKNKGKELQKYLPYILEQEYKKFEIILINNASSDDTDEILESFKEKHSNLKIIDVENNEAFWGKKKYALTLGIKAAKYNNLLFTDADCKPVSKKWISEMSSVFSEKRTIVLAYSKFKKENTLLNILARYKNLLTSIQYFSYTKIDSPYMAVRRNMGYNKSEFFKVKGFINHMHIKQGEDDLFIQDAANKENTTLCIHKNSFIEVKPPTSFFNWFQEIIVNNSTQKHYKVHHKIYLQLFLFTKFFTYILSIILFFFYPWKIILAILLTYFFIQFLVIGFSSKKLKEPQITYFLPFLEIGLLLFHFSIFITNLISKPNNWK
jgi:glycosyltransferase involved in cell wall biosynthesis